MLVQNTHYDEKYLLELNRSVLILRQHAEKREYQDQQVQNQHLNAQEPRNYCEENDDDKELQSLGDLVANWEVSAVV